MSTWRSFPERSWSPIGNSVSGFGAGEGPYDLSYAIDVQDAPHLNGRVSARLHLSDARRVQGLGVVCRADDLRSFLAFHITTDSSDPALFTVGLAAFKLGRIVSLVALKEPMEISGPTVTMSLGYFSGEITGEIATGSATVSISRMMPEIPFPGHSGVIRFYNSSTVASRIQIEAIHTRPVLPEVQEIGTRPYTVFLSHSSQDAEAVRKVAQEFKREGIPYWVDEEQITFGDPIVGKIEEGLKNSRYVVVCASENVGRSGWCRAEYGPILHREFSGDTSRRVIPLSLDGSGSESSVPLLLSDKMRADFTDNASFTAFLEFLKE
ncbi:toll/interleukin-1 receptor domain-containing protein [Nocardia asteroides]